MRITKKLAVFCLANLITFGLGVTVHRLGSPAMRYFSEPSAWQVLLSFENQDLAGLDEQSTEIVKRAIETATGPAGTNTSRSFFPSIFRKISNTKGERRYILVEESPLMFIPGEASIRVHIFDTGGRVLSRTQFKTGNRMHINSIQIRKNYSLNSEALVVDCEFWIGDHHSHEFHVVVGDELRPVYRGEGFRVDRFNYSQPSRITEPRMDLSVDEWEKELQSTDDMRVLAALAWLGGYHWDGQDPGCEEDRSDAGKVTNLMARESVRRRLADLSNSSNYFIKGTAETVVRDKQ